MKGGLTVSNQCLFLSARLCHSFPSGWHRYTRCCAEKQYLCYNFAKVVSVHTFINFVLLIHNMQTINFGRKEDEVHSISRDPQ